MEEIRENKMGNTPMLRLIVSMSLPAIFSMLVQSLYNIVDSYFVAKISMDALTAVSLAFPIQQLMIAMAVGTGEMCIRDRHIACALFAGICPPQKGKGSLAAPAQVLSAFSIHGLPGKGTAQLSGLDLVLPQQYRLSGQGNRSAPGDTAVSLGHQLSLIHILGVLPILFSRISSIKCTSFAIKL